MLETLLHQSPFGVVVIGRDRRIRWINDYACRLARVESAADVQGELCNDYLCPLAGSPCPVLDEGQEVKHSERILRRADGTEISILKTVTEIELNHESVLLETFVDISEQQRVTHELRQTLDEQEAIFESSLVGIMVLENRILTKVNRRMAEMLGYEPAEMVGRGPQQLHLSMKNFHEFGEKYYWRLAERELVQVEYPLRHKDGHAVWCQFHGKALHPPDLTRGAVWVVDDISRRKEMEEALCQSEKRFMDVLYASSDAILLIGQNKFVDCNEATARMLGYASRDEFLQTHPSELSPPVQPDGRSSAEKADAMMAQAFEQGFHRFEWMHRRAGGEDFPVEVSLTPIVHEGESLLHCVWRDITGQKRAAERLRLANDIIERSPAVAFVWKNEEGWPVEYVSRNAERLFGYPAEDFLSGAVAYANVIHSDDLERVTEEVQSQSKSPDAATVDHAPYRIVRPDGEVRWIQDMTFIRRSAAAR